MASESGDKGDRSTSLKSGRDNPSTFQVNYVAKITLQALLITTNELQAQVECNAIVLSDESGGQGILRLRYSCNLRVSDGCGCTASCGLCQGLLNVASRTPRPCTVYPYSVSVYPIQSATAA